jgi:hypothetical protein
MERYPWHLYVPGQGCKLATENPPQWAPVDSPEIRHVADVSTTPAPTDVKPTWHRSGDCPFRQP